MQKKDGKEGNKEYPKERRARTVFTNPPSQPGRLRLPTCVPHLLTSCLHQLSTPRSHMTESVCVIMAPYVFVYVCGYFCLRLNTLQTSHNINGSPKALLPCAFLLLSFFIVYKKWRGGRCAWGGRDQYGRDSEFIY